MSWLSVVVSNVALASILALAAWIVQRRLGRPAVARTLWVLVLIKLITPPIATIPFVQPSSPIACTLGICRCGPHAPAPVWLVEAAPWVLLGAWLIGVAAIFVTAGRSWIRLNQVLSSAHPASQEWQSLAARLSTELSIRKPPEILEVPGRLPPMVVSSWRRPRILLPLDLIERITNSQKEALLLHELVHIRRGDHMVRMLEFLVRAAYWWLPGIGLLGRQLRACEEAYCDQAVVNYLPQARRDYAGLLLDVVDFVGLVQRQAHLQSTAMSAAADLEERLTAILDTTQRTPSGWPIGAVVLCLACVIMPGGFRYEVGRRDLPQPTDPSAAPVKPAEKANELSAGCHAGAPVVEIATFTCP